MMQQQKQPTATLDGYSLHQTLGSGISAKVKLGKDAQGNSFAIKIFDKANARNDARTLQLLQLEVDTISKLNHPHMVNLTSFKEEAELVKRDGRKKRVAYIVLELITSGELFDFVSSTGPFTEVQARHFFTQMLQCLHYLHSNGVCHRDLKPENILLDKDFNVKIADFGFAAPIEGRDGSGQLKTVLGTLSYMAPEILARQSYMGHSVDLFAVGIILFIIYAGHPPFRQADPSDPHYKLISNNRSDFFWKKHSESKPAGYYSDSFKDLITSMLQRNPNQRLSMADIIGHPWLQGQTSTQEEITAEFATRFQKVKSDRHAEAERNQALKQGPRAGGVRRGENIGNKVYMNGAAGEEVKSEDNVVYLQMDEYDPVLEKQTQFFTTYEPEQVWKTIVDKLKDKDVSPELSEKKWKLNFEKVAELDEEEKKNNVVPDSFLGQIKLLKVDQDTICVDFAHRGGNTWYFYEQYNSLKE